MPAHELDPQNVYDNFTLEELKGAKNKEQLAADERLKSVSALFVNPKYMGQEGELSGSGPYKLKEWVSGQSLILEKKENWWGDKLANQYPQLKAYPKKLFFKIIPDVNAAISLMKNGELDVIKSAPSATFVNLKEDDFIKENYNFYSPSMFRHTFMPFNTTDTRLSDKNVRRAIAHVIDLDKIFENVYFGEKNPVASPIHPSKSEYHKGLSLIKYDITKAKELLASAGWEDTNNNGVLDKRIDGELKELNLKFTYLGGNSNAEGIADFFVESAKSAGINIVKTPLSGRPLQLGWKQKDFDITVLGSSWYPLHKDLYQRWHSNGTHNYCGFGTTESDTLIEEIQSTVDEDKLRDLYKKIQEVIYEEQPVIFVNVGNERLIVNKKFGEITTTGISPGFVINQFSNAGVPIKVSNN